MLLGSTRPLDPSPLVKFIVGCGAMAKPKKAKRKYGIGEWYGKNFLALTEAKRLEFASASRSGKHASLPCPFRSTPTTLKPCSKAGGVCSIRLYEDENGVSVGIAGHEGDLRATCPNRFHQDRAIYRWVAEVVLKSESHKAIGEVGFLKSDKGKEVGRIDSILIVPGTNPLAWCALEIQAVYFSGKKMSLEFDAITAADGAGVFPVISRRPDYRSSSAKRLLPQLQTKVPTLSRWAKKMTIVVDRGFFDSLGQMKTVSDLSHADLAWFVVDFDASAGDGVLKPASYHFTTLEQASYGLVAGSALTQDEFEARILKKAGEGKEELPDLKQ